MLAIGGGDAIPPHWCEASVEDEAPHSKCAGRWEGGILGHANIPKIGFIIKSLFIVDEICVTSNARLATLKISTGAHRAEKLPPMSEIKSYLGFKD